MRPQPRVRRWKAHELVTTVAPETSGVPRAVVLSACFVLSPAAIHPLWFVTVGRCWRRGLRSERTTMHRLDASDGHRDHTTWAGAQGDANGAHPGPGSHRAASSSARGWKLTDPSPGGDRPAARCSRRTLPRPPRPAPRIVTIAKRPSHRGGMHVNIILEWRFCQVRRPRVPDAAPAHEP